MNRRTTLLVALVLAACTADLPTAPGEAPGAPLGVALPPPPAPPTPVSGTLGGGDGRFVNTDLGYWESAVYAKITFSGLLNYSGRPDGYLPGEGEVDPSGILVQNQCNLMLAVKAVVPTGGTTVTAAPTCWYPARQVGSYVRYATIRGQLTLERWPGPPLSCYKGITPCVSYSGSQSVTVEPVPGRLILTANKDSAQPRGGLTVSAWGAAADNPSQGVPMTLREWRWEGQGPIVGATYPSIVCVQYGPTTCLVQVTQSGHVVLEALVNGVVKTERIWVRVIGGDQFPNPPVDTIPTDSIPTDTIPADTIPDGGCGSQTAGGLFLATCDTVPVPVPTATCSPGTVTRADVVECRVSLAPAVAFTVDSMVVTAGQHVIRDLTPRTVAADSVFRTSGPALLSSVVTLWVRFDSAGTVVTRSVGASFAVVPRQWSELDKQWLPAQLNRYTIDPYPVTVERFPRRTSSGGHTIRAGVHEPAQPDWGAVAGGAATSTTGPNQGLMYLSNAVGFAGAPMIYTTPLFGNLDFLVDQNGGRGRSRQRCTFQQFLFSYEPAVEAHEGTTQSGNSHWGIYKRELASLGLNSRVEALVLADLQGNDPVDSVSVWFERWKRTVSNPLHAQFDVVDYPLIPGRAGCELDLDLRDP